MKRSRFGSGILLFSIVVLSLAITVAATALFHFALQGNDFLVFPMPAPVSNVRPRVVQDEVEAPEKVDKVFRGGARAFRDSIYLRIVVAPSEKIGTDQSILFIGVSRSGRRYLAEEPLEVGIWYRVADLVYVIERRDTGILSRSAAPSASLWVHLEPDLTSIGILLAALLLLTALLLRLLVVRRRLKQAEWNAEWRARNKERLGQLERAGRTERARTRNMEAQALEEEARRLEEERKRLEEAGKVIRIPGDSPRNASAGP